MTRRRLSACLVLVTALAPVQPALPATLLITSPRIGICITGPDATFQYSWGVLHPQTGLFSYAPIGKAPLAPQISVPRSAAPGDLLRIDVSEMETVDSVTAQILGPNQQTVSRGVGFRMTEPSGSPRNLWIVLVGVTDETLQGAYTISLTITSGDRSALQLSPLSVSHRAFRFERIPITEGLEELRSSDQPRRIAEAREIARILATPHPDAIFETAAIHNPFPEARRTSGYGDRRRYVFPDNTSEYSVHEGLDLAVPEGTPVGACGRGRVVFAGQRIITGNTVILEHLPGLFSLYFHLSEVDVKTGEVVGQGDVIGKVGMTGFATGPHLHWEIDALGVPVDPDAIAAGPILDKTAYSGEIENGNAPKGGE